MSVLIVLVIILLVILGWNSYNRVRVKRVAHYLSNHEFEKGKRKAQMVDLREARDFNSGHILGARNIPYSTFKNFYGKIRPDLPVYLYDQGKTISMRAAVFLSKRGYNQLYILKDGYRKWDGKTKKRDA